MLKAEVVRRFNEVIVKDIVTIDHGAYPEGWEYDDVEAYYSEALRDENNICVVLKHQERTVGFLVAIPHNVAVAELKSDDEFMEQDPKSYYIENVAIHPAYRGKNGLSVMLETLRDELRTRGVSRISLHARVSNNLSKNIQKNMKVIRIRRIDAWKYYDYQEPADYIEAEWHGTSTTDI
jgi:ribosomal protein S18 acetylase RimI-like enzyme